MQTWIEQIHLQKTLFSWEETGLICYLRLSPLFHLCFLADISLQNQVFGLKNGSKFAWGQVGMCTQLPQIPELPQILLMQNDNKTQTKWLYARRRAYCVRLPAIRTPAGSMLHKGFVTSHMLTKLPSSGCVAYWIGQWLSMQRQHILT